MKAPNTPKYPFCASDLGILRINIINQSGRTFTLNNNPSLREHCTIKNAFYLILPTYSIDGCQCIILPLQSRQYAVANPNLESRGLVHVPK